MKSNEQGIYIATFESEGSNEATFNMKIYADSIWEADEIAKTFRSEHFGGGNKLIKVSALETMRVLKNNK